MPHSQKVKSWAERSLPLLLVGGAWASAFAQAAASPASYPADPPPSSAGFFPLAQVHAGQQGVAYTVFQGTRPEPMGVEILGVMPHALGPGQDMILARLSGAKAEYTGVVAGMSGSPVYIEGKLVGALAFRIGQFSKEPIAGITPIEQMLQVRDMPAGAATQPAAAQSTLAQPIEAPLVFNGFSPAAIELWKAHAPASVAALGAAAGLGGVSGADAAKNTGSIVPGSAVSALLVGGDLEVAATCTVTYVDPQRLLACGHPLTQFGDVSIPMTGAEVVATLPSPLNAFKIVNTGAEVGAWTEDRQAAIGGLLGAKARTIPMLVHLSGEGAPEHTLHLQVVDQAELTPTAVLVSFFQAMAQANSAGAEDSFRLRARIDLAGSPPVVVHDLLAPREGGAGAAIQAAIEVGQRFARLYDDPARRLPISGVELWAERMPGRQSAEIARATPDKTELHAGEPVELEIALRPWRGEPRLLHMALRLPANLPAGDLRILVSDGAVLDRLEGGGPRVRPPSDLPGTVAQLNAEHGGDQVYVALLAPEAQVVTDGRVLPEVPGSVANAYEPLRATQGAAVNGESVTELGAQPAGAAVSGQQVVTLHIE